MTNTEMKSSWVGWQACDQICSKISFAKVCPANKGCMAFFLVYRTNLTMDDAVARAYILASTDKTNYVALLLRGLIMQAFKETEKPPWPPSAEDMSITPNQLPKELQRFLHLMI